MIQRSPTGLPVTSLADQTAGTTQTQAGSVAATAFVNRVTTGNASDGVNLPRADFPGAIGQTVIICNLSAVVLKVYPFYDTVAAAGDGSTIDGGGANAALSQAASIARIYVCTALKTWKSALLS